MSGDLPGDATAALRHKIAVALHDLECGDRTCEPLVMGKFYRQADIALEIIRQLAIEHHAYVIEGAVTEYGGTVIYRSFADLIASERPATPPDAS